VVNQYIKKVIIKNTVQDAVTYKDKNTKKRINDETKTHKPSTANTVANHSENNTTDKHTAPANAVNTHN